MMRLKKLMMAMKEMKKDLMKRQMVNIIVTEIIENFKKMYRIEIYLSKCPVQFSVLFSFTVILLKGTRLLEMSVLGIKKMPMQKTSIRGNKWNLPIFCQFFGLS